MRQFKLFIRWKHVLAKNVFIFFGTFLFFHLLWYEWSSQPKGRQTDYHISIVVYLRYLKNSCNYLYCNDLIGARTHFKYIVFIRHEIYREIDRRQLYRVRLMKNEPSPPPFLISKFFLWMLYIKGCKLIISMSYPFLNRHLVDIHIEKNIIDYFRLAFSAILCIAVMKNEYPFNIYL